MRIKLYIFTIINYKKKWLYGTCAKLKNTEASFENVPLMPLCKSVETVIRFFNEIEVAPENLINV